MEETDNKECLGGAVLRWGQIQQNTLSITLSEHVDLEVELQKGLHPSPWLKMWWWEKRATLPLLTNIATLLKLLEHYKPWEVPTSAREGKHVDLPPEELQSTGKIHCNQQSQPTIGNVLIKRWNYKLFNAANCTKVECLIFEWPDFRWCLTLKYTFQYLHRCCTLTHTCKDSKESSLMRAVNVFLFVFVGI